MRTSYTFFFSNVNSSPSCRVDVSCTVKKYWSKQLAHSLTVYHVFKSMDASHSIHRKTAGSTDSSHTHTH